MRYDSDEEIARKEELAKMEKKVLFEQTVREELKDPGCTNVPFFMNPDKAMVLEKAIETARDIRMRTCNQSSDEDTDPSSTYSGSSSIPSSCGIGTVLFIIACIGLWIILPSQGSNHSSKKFQQQTKQAIQFGPEQPAVRLRKIMGVAYSYPKKRWAKNEVLGGNYPNVALEFWSGLVAGYATIRWTGSYSTGNKQLCLTMDRLSIPQSSILEEYYQDIGLGYGIELDNAVFSDYTMARTPFIFRTFMGDTPPKTITKCFDIIPIEEHAATSFNIEGEWDGKYEQMNSDSTLTENRFTARIIQNGNKFNGTMIDFNDGKDKRRATIEGWILGEKVTFIKRYEGGIIGISYVASYSSETKELSGRWYAGVETGNWSMNYSGDFKDTKDDILNPSFPNPPESKR